MEVVFEALLEFLLIYPGAVLRWVIFRKKSIKSYLKDLPSDNVFVAVAFFVLLIAFVCLIEFLNS